MKEENNDNLGFSFDMSKLDMSGLNLLSQDELNSRRTDINGAINEDTVFVKPSLNCSERFKVFEGLENEKYHNDSNQFVSSSRLKSLNVTEWHFVNYGKNKTTSNALQFGTVCHDDIESRIKTGKFVDWSASKLKAKTTIKLDKLEISTEFLEIIKQYRKDLQNNIILSNLIDNCISEASFFDLDRMIKVRPDIITESNGEIIIFDTKTCGAVQWFNSDIKKWGYDISAGMYTDVIEKATNKKVRWCFLIICKSTGLIKLVECKDATLQIWRDKFLELLSKANGVNKNNPTGYSKEMI